MSKHLYRKSILSTLATSLMCGGLLFLVLGTKYEGKWISITVTDEEADEVEETKLGGSLVLQAFTNGDNSFNAWNNLVYKFEKASGIKVTLISGSDCNTKQSNAWSNGNPPDIVFVDGSGISDIMMLEAGAFANLTSFYETAKIWGSNDLITDKIGFDKFEYYNGKIFEAPIFQMCNGLYSDETFLTEKGLTAPTNYDELYTFSSAVRGHGVYPLVYPGQYPSYLVNAAILPAIAAYGNQDYLDAYNKGIPDAFDLSKPDVQNILKPVLQRVYDYAHTDFGGDYGIPSSCLGYDHTQSQSDWYNHHDALICNGEWLYGEMSETLKGDTKGFKMHYSTSPFILSSQRPSVVTFPKFMGVAEHGKNKSNALAFLRYIYRNDAQTILTANYGYQSIRNDFVVNPDSYTYIANQTFATIAQADKYPKKYSNGSVSEIMNTCVNCLITKDPTYAIDVDTAINRAKEEAIKFTEKISKIGKD